MSETVVPDTKDWTWVLDCPCPECGYDASAVTVDLIPGIIRDNATTWEAVLTLEDAATRPEPGTWSPLEYACHVRDVHRIFAVRVQMLLDQDEPTFPNWDQDQTAIEERYAEQEPEEVADQLEAAAQEFVAHLSAVQPDQMTRRATRSNGSEFTVETLSQYFLHDVIHHLWDVTGQRDGAASLVVEEAS
jgi:hypothetical protein